MPACLFGFDIYTFIDQFVKPMMNQTVFIGLGAIEIASILVQAFKLVLRAVAVAQRHDPAFTAFWIGKPYGHAVMVLPVPFDGAVFAEHSFTTFRQVVTGGALEYVAVVVD